MNGRRPRSMLVLAVLLTTMVVTAASAGFSTTTGTCSTSGLNADYSLCTWEASGVGKYDKGNYQGYEMYYYSVPAASDAECSEDFALANWDYPDVQYRMVFYDNVPTGPVMKDESCTQEAMTSYPWPSGLYSGGAMSCHAYWTPNPGNWWAQDTAVQSFYKVQTDGNVGGITASQGLL